MTPEIIDRILEKYANDPDILSLLTEKSKLHREIHILQIKIESYKGQLQGLHKLINSKKLLETIENEKN